MWMDSPPKTGKTLVDLAIFDVWRVLRGTRTADEARTLIEKFTTPEERKVVARVVLRALRRPKDKGVTGFFGHGTGGGRRVIRKGTELS